MQTMTNAIGIADAAAILGVDRETVRRWVTAGRIPSFRAPGGSRGAYMLDPDDIERLAAERSLAVAS